MEVFALPVWGAYKWRGLFSEFYGIYSGVNFCGKNVCGNFYLWEPICPEQWKNCKNHKN